MKFITFRVSGQNVPLENFKQIFNGKEYYISKKGDAHYNKYTKSNVLFEEDCFSFRNEYGDDCENNTAINQFLQELLPQKDFINSLSSEWHVMLWLGLYPDGYHTNLQLSSATISLISEFAIDFNIELSFLQDIYDGNY